MRAALQLLLLYSGEQAPPQPKPLTGGGRLSKARSFPPPVDLKFERRLRRPAAPVRATVADENRSDAGADAISRAAGNGEAFALAATVFTAVSVAESRCASVGEARVDVSPVARAIAPAVFGGESLAATAAVVAMSSEATALGSSDAGVLASIVARAVADVRGEGAFDASAMSVALPAAQPATPSVEVVAAEAQAIGECDSAVLALCAARSVFVTVGSGVAVPYTIVRVLSPFIAIGDAESMAIGRVFVRALAVAEGASIVEDITAAIFGTKEAYEKIGRERFGIEVPANENAEQRLDSHVPDHVVQQARTHRAMSKLVGRRTRTGRVPRQQPPMAIEASFAAELVAILNVGRHALAPLLAELPKLLEGAARTRGDDGEVRREISGMSIVVEHAAGTERDGHVMLFDYGFIDGAIGADGEEVDVYLGPVESPEWIYVVHQMKTSDGFESYDEDKVMLGWDSADAAKAAYVEQYGGDERFFGGMTTHSSADFKARLEDGGTISWRADDADALRARSLIERARKALRFAIDDRALDSLARRMARATTAFQREQIGRQVKAALGVDIVMRDPRVQGLIEHFVGESAALIRSLGERSMHDVERIVGRAFSVGVRAEDAAAQIADRYGVHERHARLIARDQIGTLNGQVNAARQRELGIRKFVWRTMRDERVRHEHTRLERLSDPAKGGTPFSYDDLPPEGVPGSPIMCRCYAEPWFDDLLAAVEVPEPQRTPATAAAVVTAATPTETKNPKRVEAAKKAAEASVERRREIHSAVRSNLAPELHVAWDTEGYKFMQEEAGRIKGVKDRINASSKLSEAFAEKYGSGAETAFGNEGDRFFKRAEIEARHAEKWADDQERRYYEAAQRDAMRDGEINERGELTDAGRARRASNDAWANQKADDDDPPF